jgi:hypothetical protein
MRFSELPAHLTSGFRAIKIVELPLTSQPHGIQADTPEQVEARGGEELVKVMVGLRALTPGERGEVLSAAYAHAVSKGAAGEVEKSAVYQQSLAVYTVAMACVDSSSDRRRPVLFFGDTLEQAADTIRRSPLMTDDTVLYLRERQEAFQAEVDPQIGTIKDSELYDIAKKSVEDEDFLFFMRPGTLVSFTRCMAALLLSSLEANCIDSYASITSGEKSNEKPARTPRKSDE